MTYQRDWNKIFSFNKFFKDAFDAFEQLKDDNFVCLKSVVNVRSFNEITTAFNYDSNQELPLYGDKKKFSNTKEDNIVYLNAL